MSRARIPAGFACLVLLLALSVYASPYWVLYQMKSAIANRDYDAITDRIDFVSLRANIKDRIMAKVLDRMPKESASDNPFSGLGQAMALSLVGPMVDAAMSPAGVAAMMRSGEVKLEHADDDTDTAPQFSKPVDLVIAYRNWDTLTVTHEKSDETHLIFKRHGLWSWKLSDVELP